MLCSSQAYLIILFLILRPSWGATARRLTIYCQMPLEMALWVGTKISGWVTLPGGLKMKPGSLFFCLPFASIKYDYIRASRENTGVVLFADVRNNIFSI